VQHFVQTRLSRPRQLTRNDSRACATVRAQAQWPAPHRPCQRLAQPLLQLGRRMGCLGCDRLRITVRAVGKLRQGRASASSDKRSARQARLRSSALALCYRAAVDRCSCHELVAVRWTLRAPAVPTYGRLDGQSRANRSALAARARWPIRLQHPPLHAACCAVCAALRSRLARAAWLRKRYRSCRPCWEGWLHGRLTWYSCSMSANFTPIAACECKAQLGLMRSRVRCIAVVLSQN
jgi:hypothetical protein